ncbi:MAG: hypothetical protein RLZZ440_968 [Planctomycetota bacterium]|jgi:hypothetical protein
MNYLPPAGKHVVVATAIILSGCGKTVDLVPVRGRVTLDGKPLTVGAVMVQPQAGPVAQARIGADGEFCLGTYQPEDGVLPGPALVRIIARQEITPAGGERAFGPSLIPEQYTRFETSGLEVDVRPGMDPLDLQLTR